MLWFLFKKIIYYQACIVYSYPNFIKVHIYFNIICGKFLDELTNHRPWCWGLYSKSWACGGPLINGLGGFQDHESFWVLTDILLFLSLSASKFVSDPTSVSPIPRLVHPACVPSEAQTQQIPATEDGERRPVRLIDRATDLAWLSGAHATTLRRWFRQSNQKVVLSNCFNSFVFFSSLLTFVLVSKRSKHFFFLVILRQ